MKRLLLNILMCLTLAIPASGQTAFRTAELQRLATVMGLDVTSLPEGYSHPQAQGLSLTVHKASGIVDHIGRWLFADEVRQQGRMPVLNFLERYFLQLKYPPQVKSAIMMVRDDEFHFLIGSLSTTDQLLLSDDFAYTYDSNHYQVTWSRSGRKLLEVYFPVEYELISGENKIDAENNLMTDVQLTKIPEEKSQPRLIEEGTYMNKSFSNRLYLKDSVLVASPWHPLETVANMMLSLKASDGYQINITQVCYGFKKTEFCIPLQQWIAFCKSHGCELYFGVQEIDDKGMVSGVVLAVNEQENYNHVLTVKVPAQIIGKQEGIVDARLYSYVPTHNVSDMFAAYGKSNPKTITKK